MMSFIPIIIDNVERDLIVNYPPKPPEPAVSRERHIQKNNKRPLKRMQTEKYSDGLNNSSCYKNELDRYLNEPRVPVQRDSEGKPLLYDAIGFWKTQQEAYPQLSQKALDVLSCPATSCECERVFSSMKRLIQRSQ